MKVVIEYQRYVKSTTYNTFGEEKREFKWKLMNITQEINTTKVDLEMWRKDYLGHVLLMEDYNDFTFPMTDARRRRPGDVVCEGVSNSQ